jgi:hypothetical protein
VRLNDRDLNEQSFFPGYANRESIVQQTAINRRVEVGQKISVAPLLLTVVIWIFVLLA